MRIYRAPHRVIHSARKFWYRNQTTAPRLSADAFRSICDGSFYSEGDTLYSRNALRGMNVVYCNSDHLEEFIAEDLPRFTPKVLLVGNSDRDFFGLDISGLARIKAVFLQNSTVSGSPYHVLPIGIENLRLAMNGRPKYFRDLYSRSPKAMNILVGPFGNTHVGRRDLKELSRDDASPVLFQDNFMGPSRHARLSSSHMCIACPRGNGLDTHRFWETLYRGGVPVVLESEWSRNISRLGIPLVTVPSWDLDILKNVAQKNLHSHFNPKLVDSLWIPFWRNRIKGLISQ